MICAGALLQHSNRNEKIGINSIAAPPWSAPEINATENTLIDAGLDIAIFFLLDRIELLKKQSRVPAKRTISAPYHQAPIKTKRPREYFSGPNLLSIPKNHLRQKKIRALSSSILPNRQAGYGRRYVFFATASTQTISPLRNWIVIEPGHFRVCMKSDSATNNSWGICNVVPLGDVAR
jgi:hypothetical protein